MDVADRNALICGISVCRKTVTPPRQGRGDSRFESEHTDKKEMKIKTFIQSGLLKVKGKSVLHDNQIIGIVKDYNRKTGELTSEIDEAKLNEIDWNPIAGLSIGKLK